MSVQMGLGPSALRKLQSCLVAAEAACSRGDLPVVAVERALAAVVGLATATDTAAVPTELAAAVDELLKARSGAAQPLNRHPSKTVMMPRRTPIKKADQTERFDLPSLVIRRGYLFAFTSNVKYTCCPRAVSNCFKWAIWSFVIRNHLARSLVPSKFFKFNRAICFIGAIVFIKTHN